MCVNIHIKQELLCSDAKFAKVLPGSNCIWALSDIQRWFLSVFSQHLVLIKKCEFAAHWCVLLLLHSSYKETRWFGSTIFSLLWIISLFCFCVLMGFVGSNLYISSGQTLWSSDLQKTIVLASVSPRGLQRPASWLSGVFQPLLSSMLHYFHKHGQMRPTNYICEFNMQISPVQPRQGPPGTCPAVLLQLRPKHGSNLARVPVRDTFVLMTNRQTTHAYRKGREECLWWDWCRFTWRQTRFNEIIKWRSSLIVKYFKFLDNLWPGWHIFLGPRLTRINTSTLAPSSNIFNSNHVGFISCTPSHAPNATSGCWWTYTIWPFLRGN